VSATRTQTGSLPQRLRWQKGFCEKYHSFKNPLTRMPTPIKPRTCYVVTHWLFLTHERLLSQSSKNQYLVDLVARLTLATDLP
jgi:hypothetical protein